MPKIYTAGYNPDKRGGGWTFLDNFRKCFKDDLVDNPEDCDIYFITSVSMISKLSEIPLNKKIVLRVDNILKRSCNSDMYPFEGDKVTRMEAMKILAQKADAVVYQSYWSKRLLDDYLNPKFSTKILNSGDESIFYPQPELKGNKYIYLYSRSSNHDNKGWHLAYYEYQKIFKKEKNSELWIMGRFNPENIPNNFDFFNGETIRYMGNIQDREQVAFYMKSANELIYTYHMDACSNTLIEFYLTGGNVRILDKSGGASEISKLYWKHGKEYFYLDRMKKEYNNLFLGL